MNLRDIVPSFKSERLRSLLTEVVRLAVLFNYTFAILNTS